MSLEIDQWNAELAEIHKTLESNYETRFEHETPLPDLELALKTWKIDFEKGQVSDQKPHNNGYLVVNGLGTSILCHRLIVSDVLGKWIPRTLHVDHINRQRSDNRLSNLQLATPRMNANNRGVPVLEIVNNQMRQSWRSRKMVRDKEIERKQNSKPFGGDLDQQARRFAYDHTRFKHRFDPVSHQQFVYEMKQQYQKLRSCPKFKEFITEIPHSAYSLVSVSCGPVHRMNVAPLCGSPIIHGTTASNDAGLALQGETSMRY